MDYRVCKERYGNTPSAPKKPVLPAVGHPLPAVRRLLAPAQRSGQPRRVRLAAARRGGGRLPADPAPQLAATAGRLLLRATGADQLHARPARHRPGVRHHRQRVQPAGGLDGAAPGAARGRTRPGRGAAGRRGGGRRPVGAAGRRLALADPGSACLGAVAHLGRGLPGRHPDRGAGPDGMGPFSPAPLGRLRASATWCWGSSPTPR